MGHRNRSRWACNPYYLDIIGYLFSLEHLFEVLMGCLGSFEQLWKRVIISFAKFTFASRGWTVPVLDAFLEGIEFLQCYIA